ncbi:MAG: hypothetical protein AAF526_04320 [Pseudomonadota bacterium]
MTLIVEINDPSVGSFFICDCLVSRIGKTSRNPSRFPLHFGCDWTIDTRGSSLVSKFLTGSNSFIAGSGSEKDILNVADVFLNYCNKNMSEFQGFLDDYYSERKKFESYLYALESNGEYQSCHYRCFTLKKGHLNVYCGGTGASYLSKIINEREPNPEVPLYNLSAQVLAMLMRQEFIDYDFSDHAFGAAYEFLTFDRRGPRRVPYAVLDFATNSLMYQNGIHEADPRSMSLDRLIFGVPFDGGTHFLTLVNREGGAQANVTTVCEALKTPPPEVTDFRQVKSLLHGYHPEFNILLFRVSGIENSTADYIVSGNLVSWRCSGSGLEWEVDIDKLIKSLLSWNS